MKGETNTVDKVEKKPSAALKRARTCYAEFQRAERVERAQRKIMHALPKKKIERYLRILATAQAKKYSARNAFEVAAKKLKPEEFMEFHREVYA